jgi:hypothetical protein
MSPMDNYNISALVPARKRNYVAGSPGESAIRRIDTIHFVAPQGLGAWPGPITAFRPKETRRENSGDRPGQVQECGVRL